MELAAYQSLRDTQDHHWWFVSRCRIVTRLIELFVPLPANARVLEASCGDIGFANDRFALVAMFDVLEHIDDDVGSLRALAKRLATGGRMLLTVPAVPWLWSDHDVLHHHCYSRWRWPSGWSRAFWEPAGLVGNRRA